MIVQAWRKKRMPSQRVQYGGTVHLFIGTGHNPYRITFMPFTVDNKSIVICRGLNSLFIFKSVSLSAVTPKLSCSHLRRCTKLRIILVYCGADLSPKIPVHTLYSRNTVKSCFWGPSDAEGPQQIPKANTYGFLTKKWSPPEIQECHLWQGNICGVRCMSLWSTINGHVGDLRHPKVLKNRI